MSFVSRVNEKDFSRCFFKCFAAHILIRAIEISESECHYFRTSIFALFNNRISMTKKGENFYLENLVFQKEKMYKGCLSCVLYCG